MSKCEVCGKSISFWGSSTCSEKCRDMIVIHFDDKVKAIDGFFKGQIGKVKNRKWDWNGHDYCWFYYVDIGSKDLVLIEENSLRKINEN